MLMLPYFLSHLLLFIFVEIVISHHFYLEDYKSLVVISSSYCFVRYLLHVTEKLDVMR